MKDVLIAEGMALPATLPFPTRQPALLLPATSYWGEMGKTAGRGSPLNGHLQEKKKKKFRYAPNNPQPSSESKESKWKR